MQTENVPAEMVSNSNAMGKDPVLLGVTLPLSMTVSAATQVKNAWMQAAMEMVSAAKAMMAKKAGEAAPS